MGRIQRSPAKITANYLAAAMLAATAVAWLVFLGWGTWSLVRWII